MKTLQQLSLLSFLLLLAGPVQAKRINADARIL